MRYIVFTLAVLMIFGCSEPQPDNESIVEEISYSASDVKKAVMNFNKALIEKDTLLLDKLLHDSLSYGHSNGWIESKQELKDDLWNGTITYNSVKQPKINVMMIGNVATVRGDVLFNVKYKDVDDLAFDLHVLQTWVWVEGDWVMLNRQSMANAVEEKQ